MLPLADYHWDCTHSYLILLLIMCDLYPYQMILGHVMGEVP
jgi:hypothetical protein